MVAFGGEEIMRILAVGPELTVRIQKLPHGADLRTPAYQSDGASGIDLRAAIPNEITIAPGAYEVIPTGIAVAIPPYHEGQVRPRSGLAAQYGISIVNTPGTIDSDYRGEIKIILINLGKHAFTVGRGNRIAQLVFTPVVRMVLEEVESLDDTERGAGGFGSTGV